MKGNYYVTQYAFLAIVGIIAYGIIQLELPTLPKSLILLGLAVGATYIHDKHLQRF